MERDSAAGAHERNGFVDDLFGLRHVDQDETRRCHIESRSRQPRCAAIAVDDFYVAEIPRSNHRPNNFDGVRAALHTDHGPALTHTRREQTEAALWTTTDLDNPGTHPNTHLIEKPFGLMGKLLRLLHQPLLLGAAITQEVLIIACHIASRIGRPDPV